MAEKTISQLPDNPGLTGAAIVEVSQNGASYKATVDEWNALLTADVDAAVEAAEAAQVAAEAAQVAAEAAQAAAEVSATNAAGSAQSAGASQQSALSSATTATTQASNAASSATAAASSATAAGTSATNAASSATAAASSATAAGTSATNAASSATAAASSAASAASSASSASATLDAALRGDVVQSHNAATRRQMRDNAGIVNWHNVVDYGADPTGAANSATAIASAITAAGAGGVVYFPAGTYRSDTPISPLARQIICGDGPRQSYLTTQNASGSAVILGITSVSDVVVREIGFLGNAAKANNVADLAVVLTAATDCTIDNIWCDGQVQRAIFAQTGSSGVIIRNSRFAGTRFSNVLELNTSPRSTIENCTIIGQGTSLSETGIEYYSNMAVSPFLSPVFGLKVHNCRIYGVGGNGINFHGCEDGTITDCHVERTTNKGIYITDDEYHAQWGRGTGVRVENCTLVDCSTRSDGTGGAALGTYFTTRCILRNNQISYRTPALSRYNAAIEINGHENLIEGNTVYQDPRTWRGGNTGYIRYGILFSAGNSNRNTVRNNRFVNLSFGTHAAGGASSGSGADGISVQGSGNLIEGNVIEDTRASGTAGYVADATARKALSGLRIGRVVIQQSDFTAWQVIPHVQTASGLATSGDSAWAQIAPPPHFTASSQAAMLALENAEVGDICVRSDLSSPNKVKYLSALPASTLGNWVNLVPGDTTGLLATGIASPGLRYGIIVATGYAGNILKNNEVVNPGSNEPVFYHYFDNGTATRWGPFTRRVTLDIGSVAAGATVTQTVIFDVANVRQRAQVLIGVPFDFPTGLTVRGYIAASGATYTVTLVFQNFTAGALDPASGDYIITVTEV